MGLQGDESIRAEWDIRVCLYKWADSWHQGSLHTCYRDVGHEAPCMCRCGQEIYVKPQEIGDVFAEIARAEGEQK